MDLRGIHSHDILPGSVLDILFSPLSSSKPSLATSIRLTVMLTSVRYQSKHHPNLTPCKQ